MFELLVSSVSLNNLVFLSPTWSPWTAAAAQTVTRQSWSTSWKHQEGLQWINPSRELSPTQSLAALVGWGGESGKGKTLHAVGVILV